MGGFGRRFRCVCVHRPHSLVRWSKRFFWVSGMFMYLVCVSSGGCAVRSCVFRAVASAWHALVRAPRAFAPRAAQPATARRPECDRGVWRVCCVYNEYSFFLVFLPREEIPRHIRRGFNALCAPRAARALHLRPVCSATGVTRLALLYHSRESAPCAVWRLRPRACTLPRSHTQLSQAVCTAERSILPRRAGCRVYVE